MKSLLNNKLCILALVLIFTPGCRKDSPVVETIDDEDTTCVGDWCDDLPPDGGFGYNYFTEGVQYFTPCFNPNNGNEFIYTRTGAQLNPELVKYNLISKQEEVVLYPMSLGRPQWGKQGWIIFQNSDDFIWKIKDDATGLNQLTDYFSLIAFFGTNGDLVCTAGDHPDIYDSESFFPIMDLNGVLVDSFQCKFDQFQIGQPFVPLNDSITEGYFRYVDHDLPLEIQSGFCRKNSDNTITKLNVVKNGSSVIDAAANSNYIFYSKFWGGIYKIDINTKTTSTFRIGCQTKYYRYLSMSPDGDKIIAEKVILTPVNDYDIKETHEIWLLDVNGCESERILGQ